LPQLRQAPALYAPDGAPRKPRGLSLLTVGKGHGSRLRSGLPRVSMASRSFSGGGRTTGWRWDLCSGDCEALRPPHQSCWMPVLHRIPDSMRSTRSCRCTALPLKDVIQEKFGDGIMSRIDFTSCGKNRDARRARVQVSMWWPSSCLTRSGNAPR